MHTQARETVGRYRIVELLGTGRVAEVFRAHDPQLERQVAIKRILPSHVGVSGFVERFLREARLVAALDHPGVMRIYDFGEQDGAPYLVMPLFEGSILRHRLRDSQLEPTRIVAWIRQMAGALDTAHRWGILHRDVKPANVLMNLDDEPVLTDFGLARIHGAAVGPAASGMIIGTPIYMAPEVARGAPATAASDLYALAVMTYEMFCGEPPFLAESPVAVLHQHLTSPVPSLTSRRQCLPPALDEVLEHALNKNPNQRPPACEAWADELAKALAAPAGNVQKSEMLWSADNARLGSEMIRTSEIVESLAKPIASRDEEKSTRLRRGWMIAIGLIGLALLLSTLGLGS